MTKFADENGRSLPLCWYLSLGLSHCQCLSRALDFFSLRSSSTKFPFFPLHALLSLKPLAMNPLPAQEGYTGSLSHPAASSSSQGSLTRQKTPTEEDIVEKYQTLKRRYEELENVCTVLSLHWFHSHTALHFEIQGNLQWTSKF